MRDRETIDSELRRLAAERRSIRERGGELSSRRVDELLDERLGHRPETSETEAVEPRQTRVIVDTRARRDRIGDGPQRGPKAVRGRFGLLAALPLSLLAVAAAFAAMFAIHNPHPAAQPGGDPPSQVRPTPAQQTVVPPPGVRPDPAATDAHAQSRLVDRAFIDVLKHEGVPVPSQEYATTQAHAVCDFLSHQPNFAEAIGFVQRSTIWDANQSSDFAIGAVVSYCPQYGPASTDATQPAFQNALSNLQAIQGDLQGIQGDLQGIRDGLHDAP
jgi:Protein of unknown function (DUF732)